MHPAFTHTKEIEKWGVKLNFTSQNRQIFSSRVYSNARSNTTYDKQHIFNRELVSTKFVFWGFLSTSFSNVYIAFKEFQIFSSLSKIRSFQTFLNQIVSDLFKSDLFRSFQIFSNQIFSSLFRSFQKKVKSVKAFQDQIFSDLFSSFQIFLEIFKSFT